MRLYEVWTPLQQYDHAEDISATMRRKLRAIRCHASQLVRFRYDHAMRGLNRYRGVMAGDARFAEVFQEIDLRATQDAPGPDPNRRLAQLPRMAPVGSAPACRRSARHISVS